MESPGYPKGWGITFPALTAWWAYVTKCQAHQAAVWCPNPLAFGSSESSSCDENAIATSDSSLGGDGEAPKVCADACAVCAPACTLQCPVTGPGPATCAGQGTADQGVCQEGHDQVFGAGEPGRHPEGDCRPERPGLSGRAHRCALPASPPLVTRTVPPPQTATRSSRSRP